MTDTASQTGPLPRLGGLLLSGDRGRDGRLPRLGGLLLSGGRARDGRLRPDWPGDSPFSARRAPGGCRGPEGRLRLAWPGDSPFSIRRDLGGCLLAGGLVFAGALFAGGAALFLVALTLFASLVAGLVAAGAFAQAGFFVLLMALALSTACSTRLPQVEGDPGGLFTASTAEPLPEPEPAPGEAVEEEAVRAGGQAGAEASGAQDPPEPPGLLGARRLPLVESEQAHPPPSGVLSEPGFGSRRFTVKVGLLSDSLRRLVEDRFAWTLKWVSETDRRIEGEFDISAASLEGALRELLGLYQGAFVADLYDANRMVLVREAPLGARIHDAAKGDDADSEEDGE